MPRVFFEREGLAVEAEVGETIAAVARRHGVPLHRGLSELFHCPGLGLCGSCRVYVRPAPAVSGRTLIERLHRTDGALRLACRTEVLRDCVVDTVIGLGVAPRRPPKAKKTTRR